MSIATYDELKTAISDQMHRANDAVFVSKVPDFISLAEAMIRAAPDPEKDDELPGVRDLIQEKRASAQISTEFSSVPTDMLEIHSLLIDAGRMQALDYKGSQRQLLESYPYSTPGRPKAYTMIGDEIQVRPIPDQSYTMYMTYNAQFISLSAENTSNWLLQNNPGVYLYGALVAACQFTRDPDQTAEYARLYRALVNGLNERAKEAKLGMTLVSRPDGMTP